MYSNDQEENAKKLIKELEENGIKVKCTGTSNATHSQFIAHTSDITKDYYKLLRKKVPTIKTKQFVYDPINYYCGNTDFTIVLSEQ